MWILVWLLGGATSISLYTRMRQHFIWPPIHPLVSWFRDLVANKTSQLATRIGLPLGPDAPVVTPNSAIFLFFLSACNCKGWLVVSGFIPSNMLSQESYAKVLDREAQLQQEKGNASCNSAVRHNKLFFWNINVACQHTTETCRVKVVKNVASRKIAYLCLKFYDQRATAWLEILTCQDELTSDASWLITDHAACLV